jgi:hypothetical protein
MGFVEIVALFVSRGRGGVVVCFLVGRRRRGGGEGACLMFGYGGAGEEIGLWRCIRSSGSVAEGLCLVGDGVGGSERVEVE